MNGDVADRADEIIAINLQLAMAAHEQATQDVDQVVIAGNVICVDCDDVIPPERVAAKHDCVRCITCQEIHEKEAKLWK